MSENGTGSSDAKASLLSKLIDKSSDKQAIWGVLGLIAGGLMAVQIAKGDYVTAISAGVAMFAGIVVWRESKQIPDGKKKKQPLTTRFLKGISVVAFAIVLFLLIVKLSLKLFPSGAKEVGFQAISDFLHNPLSLVSERGTIRVEESDTGTPDGKLFVSVNKVMEPLGAARTVTFTVGLSGDPQKVYEQKVVGFAVNQSGYEIRVTQIGYNDASFHVAFVQAPAETQLSNK